MEKMAHLYFVRHAHSAYTPDELGRPLSSRGYADAARVTEILKREKIDYVYSSPYKRAIQTVEGIAGYINKEILIEDHFKERMLARDAVDDFSVAITKVWEDEDFAWKGGESNNVAQRRGVLAAEKIIERHMGEKVVIGTHGNLMVLIMNYYNKSYGFDFWRKLEMPAIYKLSYYKKNLVNAEKIDWQEGNDVCKNV
jgi:2,3-bisphosphoglycerate-dependent phosphoglycerate mutase